MTTATAHSHLYDLTARSLTGAERPMSDYRGQVLLVVNTASKCGFTPHYTGLQTLHDTYGDKGLQVIGFPCNQFGSQEPGSSEDISSFCQLNYGVTFDMFDKIDVNGAGTHPVYRWLKSEGRGVLGSEAIKWNFTKFLVSRDGRVLKRYAPTTKPAAIAKDIEKALEAT